MRPPKCAPGTPAGLRRPRRRSSLGRGGFARALRRLRRCPLTGGLQSLAQAGQCKSELVSTLCFRPRLGVILEIEVDEAEVVVDVRVALIELLRDLELFYRFLRFAHAREIRAVNEPDHGVVGG